MSQINYALENNLLKLYTLTASISTEPEIGKILKDQINKNEISKFDTIGETNIKGSHIETLKLNL